MKPKEFADKLGVTTTTLRNWDKSGKLVPKRTVTNQRFYTDNDLKKVLGDTTGSSRKNIIYARVSTSNQRDDLKDQVLFLREFTNAHGVIIDEVVSDIGSGLNYKRKKWNKLLDAVMDNMIDTIYISYKDRFIRFGFDWFEHLCNKFGTKIVVVNNETTSPEKEVVDDLISIIHVFSCRVYGLRKYKVKLKNERDIDDKDS